MAIKPILFFVLLSLLFSYGVHAQCNLYASIYQCCRGTSVIFTATTNTSGYSIIKWNFGDGDSIISKSSSLNHSFDTFGTFTISAAFYDSLNNLICNPKTIQMRVFDVPLTKFYLLTPKEQSFKNNGFIFSDSSTPGNSKTPIKHRIWDFGDQHSDTARTATHTYIGCATFSPSLIVTDSNQCSDTLIKKDFITTSGPNAKFIVLDNWGYVPHTSFIKDASANVSKCVYLKGDSTSVTFNSRARDSIFAIKYYKTGVFYISLIGYDSFFNNITNNWVSCSSEYGNIINPDQPQFKIHVYPIYSTAFSGDTLICSGDYAYFYNHSDPQYDTFVWKFDDTILFITGKGDVQHQYILPDGVYSKSYLVEMQGSGSSNDTFCPDITKHLKVRVIKTKASIDTVMKSKPIILLENSSKNYTRFLWQIRRIDHPDYFNIYDTISKTINFSLLKSMGDVEVCLKTWYEKKWFTGCADDTCITIHNGSYATDHIFIYPNPFSEWATVSFPENPNAIRDIFLIDIRGKEVQLAYSIYQDQLIIHRNNIPSGIYLIKIIANQVYQRKIIIE